MGNLQERFTKHWAERRFGQHQQIPLLAVSGGVDSMVLATLLSGADIKFAVAHCNFTLRGEASDGDAEFVRDWCEAHGVPIHIRTFNTAAIAEEMGISIQLAARELRYKWFEELRQEFEYATILTAHHADDVAETMIINLCRGTGIAGLHGIPERNGTIVRPLLFATRSDILEFARARAIGWREDSSNATDYYLRNALRHHVLPKLNDLIQDASKKMADTAFRMAEAEAIYRTEVTRRKAGLLEQRGKDWYLPVRLLQKQAQLQTIAYEVFKDFGYSADQVPHILRLMESESGRFIASATHRVIKHGDFLVVTADITEIADLILIDEIPTKISMAEGTISFSWTAGKDYTEDPNTALLAGDEIQLPLVLRTRREGDYFYPLGMGGKKKKLKRFLIDIKVPVHEKDKVRILECNKRILWIVGKRIDERFKVNDGTKQTLKVVYKPLS